MGPKWTPFLYAIFGLPPTQPLRLALVDPTDRILKAVGSFQQQDRLKVVSLIVYVQDAMYSSYTSILLVVVTHCCLHSRYQQAEIGRAGTSRHQLLTGAPYVVPAVWSATRAFPLFLPPSPSFLFQRLSSPPPRQNEKPQPSSWKLEPSPTAIREGHTERERDSTQDNGKHNKKTKRSQNSVLDRYVS
jgi:hypothetical protein